MTFDPDKHVDKDGAETGETNALRTARAATALAYYDNELIGHMSPLGWLDAAERPPDWLAASELIADIAHWCDKQGADISAVIGLGLRNWQAER